MAFVIRWWNEDGSGPKKWTYTVYGIGFATVHLILAIFDWKAAQEMWEKASWFYNLLIATTTFSATAIEINKKRVEAPK